MFRNLGLRNVGFASLAVLVAIGGPPVAAQAPSSHAMATTIPADAGNVVGGGGATMFGGGDDRIILYSGGGAGGGSNLAQTGWLGRFAGTNGDGPQVEYQGPAPAGRGRQAWLLGGGDNTEVVYSDPAGR